MYWKVLCPLNDSTVPSHDGGNRSSLPRLPGWGGSKPYSGPLVEVGEGSYSYLSMAGT
jgi:hypothetical protein